MPLPTMTVKNGAGADAIVNLPNSGRRNAGDSQAVVLSNEDLATLASIVEKLPVLVSGLLPVLTQRTGMTSRAYAFAAGQRLTTSGTGQVRSTAIAATEVTLVSSVRGFFRVGDASVAASVGAGSMPIPADLPFTLQITSGQFISFIRDGATDGSLSIMPVA